MATLVEKAQKFVLQKLNEELPNSYLYHNYTHTQRVVKHVTEIIEAERLNEVDTEILQLAAWFHDIGYIKGGSDHEKHGAEIANEFLTEHGFPPEKIKIIQEAILSTSMDIEPETPLQKMLCDADFSHFASKNYEEVSSLLREEFKQLGIRIYSDREWIEENIKMFNQHHKFFTLHAVEHWQPQKNKNLLSLNKELKKIKKKKKEDRLKASVLDGKIQKQKLPERGIETMFRVTLKNHITLSDIADTKANILLSVNAIIISLAISNLIPKLDNPSNSYLIYPTLIFLIFSLVSMGLSVLATRPNVTSGKFTKEDVENKKVNLLFFGNFHKMKLNEFEWAINEVMKDKDYLYSSMTKDLYFLGVVLHRKYKILRLTYAIFLFGIVFSVLAFGIAFQISETAI
ncbi:HD domain-containing protein [Flavobacteriaceae bacterium R38]|nr:HD domain-containing protein [Flavobacteriaceae bacterium R38]